jgi:pre-mRNA-splicing helicase BRR2
VNDYLSELIELTTEQLQQNKCIAIEEQVDLLPLNFGHIASYYYIKTDTIELFSQNLDSQSKMKNILEILSQSSEFQFIPIRHRDDHLLKLLQQDLVYKIDKPKFNDPMTKTNILLQCHFSRKALPADFSWDQKIILEQSTRLISGTLNKITCIFLAMVNVMSSNCWLKPAILAIQLC